ncbi:hypothetical protein [Catellatospora citrea]|uniref:hypothetical protein n=1 Tax=Catellatospora citrea TaxID=53366 RepID=UPI0011C4AAB0|nr:hypothetical protein [Catellatospora citrea]
MDGEPTTPVAHPPSAVTPDGGLGPARALRNALVGSTFHDRRPVAAAPPGGGRPARLLTEEVAPHPADPSTPR